MSRVQIILTPSGERLAILPAEDYEALVAEAPRSEDAADLARIDEILAKRGKRGAPLPALGMKRLLAGENPVSVWREARGMSQAELAAKAGFGPSHINMIENGKRVGTVATLKRIARALEVDLDDLTGTDASS
ncbi:MAG: helix-turn-helix transcriptional regulator [Bauldia sp.]